MTTGTSPTNETGVGANSVAVGTDAPRRPTFLKRLAPLITRRKRALSFAAGLAVVSVVTQVAAPAIARSAIDAALAGDRDDLTRFAILLGVVGLLRFVFGGLLRFSLFHTAYAIETDLRDEIYKHLTLLSFSFYDRTQGGDVISRANSDIRSIQIYLAFAPLVFSSLFVFVLAFSFMLTIDVWLTIVALSPLPGVYLSAQQLRRRVFPLTWVSQARMAELAGRVDENISGVRVIKSFAAESEQIEGLARSARRLRWSTTETILERARYSPLIEALPRFGTGLVLLYGGWRAIDGSVSVGTLFAFSAYVIMLQLPFRLVGFLLLQGERANAASDRIFEILDEDPEIADQPAASPLPNVEGRVEFSQVSFAYPSLPSGTNQTDHASETPTTSLPQVLADFDLTISPGETVAIVGRTGAGKSTIPRLLGRFYDPTSGTVRLDGHDLGTLPLSQIRRTVAMVLDDPFLFSVSLHDNIAYGRPDATRAEVQTAANAAQAHGFITDLPDGYDTVVGERGYTLSGGQRQRIAIARALLVDPAVLVLDDATSAIDVHVEADIHRCLGALLGQRTTLVIAHRISAIGLADRIVLLEEGRIVNEGTHDYLLRTDRRYAEILAGFDTDDDADADPNQSAAPLAGPADDQPGGAL